MTDALALAWLAKLGIVSLALWIIWEIVRRPDPERRSAEERAREWARRQNGGR